MLLKKKVVIPLMLAVMVLVSSVDVSAVEMKEGENDTIIVSEKYSGTSEDEKYNFKETIEYKGKKYSLDKSSITVSVLSEKPKIETKHETVTDTKVSYTQITQADGIKVKNEDDGKTYTAVVEDIQNEKTTIRNRTANVKYTRTVTVPATEQADIEQEWTFEYEDKDNNNKVVEVTAPLKEQSVVAGKWIDTEYPISITVNNYGADTITMLDKEVKLGDDVPFSSDYYNLILQTANRDTENYRITSTKWDGPAYSDGGVVKRNAIAYTQQQVKEYKLEYSGNVSIPDCDGYEVTITYISNKKNQYTILKWR